MFRFAASLFFSAASMFRSACFGDVVQLSHEVSTVRVVKVRQLLLGGFNGSASVRTMILSHVSVQRVQSLTALGPHG